MNKLPADIFTSIFTYLGNSLEEINSVALVNKRWFGIFVLYKDNIATEAIKRLEIFESGTKIKYETYITILKKYSFLADLLIIIHSRMGYYEFLKKYNFKIEDDEIFMNIMQFKQKMQDIAIDDLGLLTKFDDMRQIIYWKAINQGDVEIIKLLHKLKNSYMSNNFKIVACYAAGYCVDICNAKELFEFYLGLDYICNTTLINKWSNILTRINEDSNIEIFDYFLELYITNTQAPYNIIDAILQFKKRRFSYYKQKHDKEWNDDTKVFVESIIRIIAANNPDNLSEYYHIWVNGITLDENLDYLKSIVSILQKYNINLTHIICYIITELEEKSSVVLICYIFELMKSLHYFDNIDKYILVVYKMARNIDNPNDIKYFINKLKSFIDMLSNIQYYEELYEIISKKVDEIFYYKDDKEILKEFLEEFYDELYDLKELPYNF